LIPKCTTTRKIYFLPYKFSCFLRGSPYSFSEAGLLTPYTGRVLYREPGVLPVHAATTRDAPKETITTRSYPGVCQPQQHLGQAPDVRGGRPAGTRVATASQARFSRDRRSNGKGGCRWRGGGSRKEQRLMGHFLHSGLEQAAWHCFCAPQDDMSGKHTPWGTTRQIHGNAGPVTYKAAHSWASYLSYHCSVFGSSKALSHASFKAAAISLRSSCLYAGTPCNVRRNRTMFVFTSTVSRNTSSLQ
jgi:hypothetical protein